MCDWPGTVGTNCSWVFVSTASNRNQVLRQKLPLLKPVVLSKPLAHNLRRVGLARYTPTNEHYRPAENEANPVTRLP